MMFLSKAAARRPTAAAAAIVGRRLAVVRTHFTHGGGGLLDAPPVVETGPRTPLRLGLDSARSTTNILRLLESSHGAFGGSMDAIQSVWYEKGQQWKLDNDNNWKAYTLDDMLEELEETSASRASAVPPTLLFLSHTDDCTALAKLMGADGRERYVSMLKFSNANHPTDQHQMNDGWKIVREIVGAASSFEGAKPENENGQVFHQVSNAVRQYLEIEHGGGKKSFEIADKLFASDASLLAVGSSPPDEPATDWSAPTGTPLEVPRDLYLESVLSQTPHLEESSQHDAIVQMDVLQPCRSAAAATVMVGNGACDRLFVDHLLLGKTNDNNNNQWIILSKVFAPRPWPR